MSYRLRLTLKLHPQVMTDAVRLKDLTIAKTIRLQSSLGK